MEDVVHMDSFPLSPATVVAAPVAVHLVERPANV